jgi:hypothetical protein
LTDDVLGFEVREDPRIPPGTMLIGEASQIDALLNPTFYDRSVGVVRDRAGLYDCCDRLIGAPHDQECPVRYELDGQKAFDPAAIVRIVVTP